MKPTLVVLAAGMGSRYGGVKQIDSVGLHGECLLDFATYDAKLCGFGNVVYIIRKDIEHDFRERLFDRVAKNFDASYVFQSRESLLTAEQIAASKDRAKPWGTVHALLCARDAISAPFTVINADDYYGRDAFKTLGAYLSGVANDCTVHAMVGYVLGNTMSKSGSVSRGICTVKDGFLESIVENLKIYYEGDGIVSDMNGEKIPLTGKEWVSMNCFGFTPASFASFAQFWEEFIKANLESPKAEALLPSAVEAMIKNGDGSLKFFTSSESWFGMTYPEDREIVKKEIAKKIAEQYYPEKLWKKE